MPKVSTKKLAAKNVTIENFRGIKSAKIELDPEMTILVGKNGAGKTSILEAISLSLLAFNQAWELVSSNSPKSRAPRMTRIESDDVRDGSEEASIHLDISLPFQDIFGDSQLRISTQAERPRLNESFHALARTLDQVGSDFRKPLFVYYQQDRSFEAPSRRTSGFTGPQDMLEGDLRAITHLEEWWDRKDAEEARKVRDTDLKDYRDPQLQAIRSLVQRVETFQDIYFSYSARQTGLYFKKRDGTTVHISKLSGGERSYIILLADLARRLQISFPNLDISEIPGIVLVDEIELNLHPKWQSEIISTLREIFRSCQFIITTHSPQVISAALSENVRIIHNEGNGDIKASKPLSTHGRTSNYLLEGIFDATERLPEVDMAISQFNVAIEQKELMKATNLLKEIERGIEGTSSDLLLFKKRLKRLKG
jgi:predicted ATP-binding protein involved in virulence